MIAVAVEQIVRRPLKLLCHFFDDRLDFMARPECEALEKFAAESSSGRFLSRSRPINARHSGSIMPSKSVLSAQAFDHDTGV